jgi:hypothetical protein
VAGKFKEIGNTGLMRQGGYVYEEFVQDLRFPRAARVYKEMSSNDPTIGAIIYMAKQLVRKADWRVVADGKEGIDEEAKLFLEECIDDMSTTWQDLIAEILSMLTYGFSWHELVFKKRNGYNGRHSSKYNDGMIGWARIAPRSQESITEWIFNEESGSIVAAVQQSPGDSHPNVIPIAKSLLFRTEITRDNPEGRSLLRNAYRPWYFKKHIEEIEGIGIERDLAGLPMIVPPEDVNIWDTDDPEMVRLLNVATTIVTSIRRDQNEGVVIPFGWKLELLSTGSQRQFDTNEILNRYDQRIAITMLADVVMLGADKVGSFALADVKRGLLASSLESILDSIASTFNRYAIPQLFSYNPKFVGLKKYPKLAHDSIESPSLVEFAAYIKALTGAQVNLTDLDTVNYLRGVGNIPKVDEDSLVAQLIPTEQDNVDGTEADTETNVPEKGDESSGGKLHDTKDNSRSKPSVRVGNSKGNKGRRNNKGL